MTVPARVSFVTLAVHDMPRMVAFYRQFGWPESATNSEHHVAFQTGGAVLGIYAAANYRESRGEAPPPGAFRGFTLAINLEDAAAVDAAHATLSSFEGVDLHGEPEDLFFGGRGFSFSDPEGNVWDVIWKSGTTFDARGGLIFP